MKSYYITTPIYYPSGKFHIGTAYTTILSDFLARYKRNQGFDVKFLTGMDEHGMKIEEKAKEAGLTPQIFVDEKAEMAQNMWKKLNISEHGFIRTTDSKHKELVKKIYEKMLENEDIYKGHYSGWYCTPCETFFTESQLVDSKCPDCNREVKITEEECYFFNMKKYEDRFKQFYEENPTFLEPLYRKEELFNNFINKGLEDLCISRTTFEWGIKLPNDPKHVLYVWLDALCNYITHLGYLSEDETAFNKYWPADLQIVGKDIIRFHAIYWPIFLMALNLQPPKKLYAHGWILMKDGKMSKSKGNLVYPDELANRYSVDAVRYIIFKLMGYGSDAEFTPEIFVEKYNTDLCNDLGNLLNRTIAMVNKYFEGNINDIALDDSGHDEMIETTLKKSLNNYHQKIDELHFSDAISELWNIISTSNKYIDLTAPWNLAKEETEMNKLKSVLYHLVINLKEFAYNIDPLIPDTAQEILKQIGCTKKDQTEFKVVEKGTPLFIRLDMEQEVEEIKKLMI